MSHCRGKLRSTPFRLLDPGEELEGELNGRGPGGAVAGEGEDLDNLGEHGASVVAHELAPEGGEHLAVALEVDLALREVELVRARDDGGGDRVVPHTHVSDVGDETGEPGLDIGLEAGEVLVRTEEGDDAGACHRVLREAEDGRKDVAGDGCTLQGELGDDTETLHGGGLEVAVDHLPLPIDILGGERGLGKGGAHVVGHGLLLLLLLGKALEATVDRLEATVDRLVDPVEGEVATLEAHELEDVRAVNVEEDLELDVA